MPAAIIAIAQNTPAAKKKIAQGDVLLSVNGHEIQDVLDYRFHTAERRLQLKLQRGSKIITIRIRKDEYEDLGLEFGDGLMDKQRRCKNNCIFCFIDQLPPGLRESLYFKDDDARLSFLFGNYITLTNITEQEVHRMISMRLSPVNVSVHTMNPVLRRRMMGNQKAGDYLIYLPKFAEAGLDINAQLVLCPGWNDGDELRYSLQELLKLPTVRSIAAVPVGLTKHRENLTQLRGFTPEEAGQVIDIFDAFRKQCQPLQSNVLANEGSIPELCASDEFFLLAGHEIPGVEYYGEFRQIENGVGLWASLRQDFLELLHDAQLSAVSFRRTIVTSEAADSLLQFLVDETRKIWHNININVRCVRNDFFGPQITVAGLLTGRDIIAQLYGEELGQALLLPAAMFNKDGLTLDGMTIHDISQAINIPAIAVENEAEALLHAMLGEQ